MTEEQAKAVKPLQAVKVKLGIVEVRTTASKDSCAQMLLLSGRTWCFSIFDNVISVNSLLPWNLLTYAESL